MTSIKTYKNCTFSDRVTPVGMYLNLRNLFPQSILLESSEVDDQNYAHSILCADPIAGISFKNDTLSTFIGSKETSRELRPNERIQYALSEFVQSFESEKDLKANNGFFGFQSFESVRYFESKEANLCPEVDPEIPIFDYRLYRYVISFNHFNGKLIFQENTIDGAESTLESLIPKLMDRQSGTYNFRLSGSEQCHDTDNEFLDKVRKAQEHCQVGDVFQMVLSRHFRHSYTGDDFNVYRALRHINPSPYMFFFDYGKFKLFGSSPETQLQIKEGVATVNPIAGTYKRTGDKQADNKAVEALLKDPKELAEHAMLVDLARNDLNRHCDHVRVTEYKSIHQYSHVMHMVSKVQGELSDKQAGTLVLADTFPAGTLSGAPKVRAIQLLADLEGEPRGVYGGSVGFIDFEGGVNQAIVIRSFLVKGGELHYRAGAGIVLNSNPQTELEEVKNKLGALRNALQMAEEL
ncbi:anthranilate synthase component I family protein [Bacteroidota bacterium]